MLHAGTVQSVCHHNRSPSSRSDGSLQIIGAADDSHVKVSSSVHAGRSPCIALHPVDPDVPTAVLQGHGQQSLVWPTLQRCFAGSQVSDYLEVKTILLVVQNRTPHERKSGAISRQHPMLSALDHHAVLDGGQLRPVCSQGAQGCRCWLSRCSRAWCAGKACAAAAEGMLTMQQLQPGSVCSAMTRIAVSVVQQAVYHGGK